MSGIVLSASVRQNLLSLQSTADLLSTTQNRLATGNKVNSALDNPTNFFTAAGPQQPRQRHQQPARQHRQRRAGAAGRQHRHHLAAEAGRYRQVDRQPGAAGSGRLLHQVQRHRAVRTPAARLPTCSAPTLAQGDVLTIAVDGRRYGVEHHVRHRCSRSRYADRAQCGSRPPTTCRLRSTTPPARSRSPRPTTRLRPPSVRSAVPRSAPARRSCPRR